MSEAVPDVPDPLPEPLEHLWPAGKPFLRCHHIETGATEFNATAVSRRFRPVIDDGQPVATIYGADLEQGALSETVFHDVPVRGSARRVQRRTFIHQVLSAVRPTRQLRLIRLHGAGLTRLQVTHGELVESSAQHYPRTARWAQALYDCDPGFDGLIWRSRQFNDSYALVLWDGRVRRFDHLEFDRTRAPLPLYVGAGLSKVQQHADECGITVVY